MKRAMVTGASEGIGKQFALQLSQRGYAVTAVARSQAKLEALGVARTLVADLSAEQGQASVVKALASERYELLINNAGVGLHGDFASTDVEKTLAMMHLNCDALVRLAHAFLQQAQRGDALVNVSSAIGYMPAPTMAVYAATKAFVTTFSEALWAEQEKRGVFVQALHPGNVTSKFQETAGVPDSVLIRGLSETPEALVTFALKALDARSDPSVVSGLANVAGTQLAKLIPRKALVKLMGLSIPK